MQNWDVTLLTCWSVNSCNLEPWYIKILLVLQRSNIFLVFQHAIPWLKQVSLKEFCVYWKTWHSPILRVSKKYLFVEVIYIGLIIDAFLLHPHSIENIEMLTRYIWSRFYSRYCCTVQMLSLLLLLENTCNPFNASIFCSAFILKDIFLLEL